MKKNIIFLTALLVLLMTAGVGHAWAQSKTAYAVLTDNDEGKKTLTFKYEDFTPDNTTSWDVTNTGTSTPGWYTSGDYKNITKVVFDESFADARPKSSYGWFFCCENLTTITGLEYLNTSQVITMHDMFYCCSKLESLDLSNFNTSQVTDMGDMFIGCSGLTSLDVSHFNTSKVKNMKYMFEDCSSLTSLDVSHFITNNVTSMSSMFRGCSGLTSLDLSHFNTSKVTDMNNMFNGCSSLTSLDVSNFNTSNVTDMYGMFWGCSNLTSLDVSNFNTSQVTDMSWMFYCCSNLTNLDLSNFNTSQVEEMYDMFNGCSSLTSLDVSSFNTSKVGKMGDMFNGCSRLTSLAIGSGFTVGGTTDTKYMFESCDGLATGTLYVRGTTEPDIAQYIFGTETGIDTGVFTDGTLITEADLAPDMSTPFTWHGGTFTTVKKMTTYAVLTGGGSNKTLTFKYEEHELGANEWDVSDKVTTYPGWYTLDECENITQVVFEPSFADARPKSCYMWFYNFQNLTTITGIEYLNTSQVKSMWYMFDGCSSLTSLDLSHFNTSQVTTMDTMFRDCESLTSLDVSSFNTSQVEYMYNMFEWCRGLTSLAIGKDFTVGGGTKTTKMFDGCTKLANGTLYVKGATAPSIDQDIFGIFTNGTLITDMTKEQLGITESTSPYHWKGGTFTTVKENTFFAVLTDNAEGKKTLTFKYGEHDLSATNEWDVTNTGSSDPGWYSEKGKITQVVFDKSFADARPKSCYSWFSNFPNLTTITGIENLNTSEVTDMSKMFRGCIALTSLDLSHFDTSQVTNMNSMFRGCSGLTKLDLSSFNTSQVTNMNYMFYGCSCLTDLDVSQLNTGKVTEMGCLFGSCIALTSLDVSHFDTSQVTNMQSMFSICKSLTSLDVSHFNTSEVIDMAGMFEYCENLTSLDVSSFNTSQVIDMDLMFKGCTKLKSLCIGKDFTIKNSTNTGFMLEECIALSTGTLYVKGTSAPSIAKDIFGVFTNGTLVTAISQTDLGYTGPDADGKYTWKGGTFSKPMQLANKLGANVTVTFYDGGAAEPIGFDVTAPGTPVTSADAGQWIVMHIVPAEGYWTDAQLLMASEAVASLARTRAPGFDLGQIPTLLKRDLVDPADPSSGTRYDGAGWYYYQIPADHTYAAGYTTSVIDGYVVKKFNLSIDPVTKNGTVFTVAGTKDDYTTLSGWTVEFTYDQLSYKFDALPHSPTLQSVVIKKAGIQIFELTGTDITNQVKVPEAKVSIFPQHSLNLEPANVEYTWFKGSVSSTVACFEITVPFKGSGTTGDPWQIETTADLNLLSKCTNVGGYSFRDECLKQLADIDMNGITDFQPIAMGNGEGVDFNGSYNGDGKTIKNLTYQQKSSEANGYAGLFGYVEDGTVQNVSLENCQFSASYKTLAMGGIAGYLKQGTISGCTVKGNSSVKGLYDGCATGAIVGQLGDAGTLSKNYYTYDVSVGNSSGTATGYVKRGYWKTTAWDDVNDATEGAMLLVRKATLPAASANGSTVTFNEVTKGTDRYDRTGDDFYYAVGQSVTINVTTGKQTETTDIRTFYDELSTLTMNGSDIKEKLAFTMPDVDATIAASFSTSTWFTIDTNQKEWMSFYHEWENTAPANYTVSDGSDTGKTIGVKTITGVNLQTGDMTPADLGGVSYNGVPTLFYCEGNLPEKLKFTPNTTATNSVTPYSKFTGTTKALTAADLDALGNGLYVMNSLGEFIRAYDHTGGLAAHRCYINLGSEAAPARLRITDETVGISHVDIDFIDDAWYSLDGRKLDSKPTKKGLYINGGRKVVIK